MHSGKMEVLCIWTRESVCKLHTSWPDLAGHTPLFLSQLVPAPHLPQPYLVCCSVPSLPSTRFSFLNNADPPTHSVFAVENTFRVHRTARTVWKTAWRCARSLVQTEVNQGDVTPDIVHLGCCFACVGNMH